MIMLLILAIGNNDAGNNNNINNNTRKDTFKFEVMSFYLAGVTATIQRLIDLALAWKSAWTTSSSFRPRYLNTWKDWEPCWKAWEETIKTETVKMQHVAAISFFPGTYVIRRGHCVGPKVETMVTGTSVSGSVVFSSWRVDVTDAGYETTGSEWATSDSESNMGVPQRMYETAGVDLQGFAQIQLWSPKQTDVQRDSGAVGIVGSRRLSEPLGEATTDTARITIIWDVEDTNNWQQKAWLDLLAIQEMERPRQRLQDLIGL